MFSCLLAGIMHNSLPQGLGAMKPWAFHTEHVQEPTEVDPWACLPSVCACPRVLSWPRMLSPACKAHTRASSGLIFPATGLLCTSEQWAMPLLVSFHSFWQGQNYRLFLLPQSNLKGRACPFLSFFFLIEATNHNTAVTMHAILLFVIYYF